ncbi:MAG: hypothetical protein OHK0021_00890 [Bryobacter sp.]
MQGSKGKVGFVMYSSPEGWPNDYAKAYRDNAKPAQAGTVEMKFTGIAPGKYAVVALHDENENKKLDKKGSGRPKEGWGMSRDPKARLKTPKFDSAAVDVACGDRIEFTLRYPTVEDEKSPAQ